MVDAENKAATRPVQVRGVRGSEWIITGGLAAGERVIVEGLQKVREGGAVQAQPFNAPSGVAASPQAVAASGPTTN